ncbi:helix-turn-helix transcriptional regulator [Carnobacterium maltaromaticum]|uniref:helix-turn-helix domain-containing protein n=1 Tax=Carnobacterium maltaromaticum TaxID=2751 RepID=UPI00295F05C6|nr:helix-turn-helix transcriptional regulator [Carnobacterium maltaromaticum]
MDIGIIIRESRKAKGITQFELADGICTQAAISSIERNGAIPSTNKLLAIADRLNLDFTELSYYISHNSTINSTLQQSKKLIREEKYLEAKDLLQKNIDGNVLSGNESKEYNYYLGIIYLEKFLNYSEARFHFNISLQEISIRNDKIIEALATNGIAVSYMEENEISKSTKYFEKSINLLEEIKKNNDSILESADCLKLYSNIAKYYIAVKKYNIAFDFCLMGIKLQQKKNILNKLEEFYYYKGIIFGEKGNLAESNRYFFISLGLCEVNKNKNLIKKIVVNSQKVGLKSIYYQDELI